MDHVVLGALVRSGQVLLVHRRPDKPAFPDVWDLPGGLVEAGEPELAALSRELREELGVEIETRSAFLLSRVTVDGGSGPAVLSAWVLREWEGTPGNLAPEEHDDMRWSSLEELPPPLHPSMRPGLVRALRHEAPDSL